MTFSNNDASPVTVRPGVKCMVSRCPRCSSSPPSKESCFLVSSDKSTGPNLTSVPASMREMVSISWIRLSIRPVTLSERSRYLSRSRYTCYPLQHSGQLPFQYGDWRLQLMRSCRKKGHSLTIQLPFTLYLAAQRLIGRFQFSHCRRQPPRHLIEAAAQHTDLIPTLLPAAPPKVKLCHFSLQCR